MYSRFIFFAFLVIFFSCKETVFDAGLENRVTAIIDMVPESYNGKIDFTSDAQVGDCNNHDILYIEEVEDGSSDNKHYRLKIEARDYFRTENNCEQDDWYTTEDEDLEHKLEIFAFSEHISDKMYIQGSPHIFDGDGITNSMGVIYTLKKDGDGNTNSGYGIKYYGHIAEIEFEELNIGDGTASGFFNATLYRANEVYDPSDFVGVDSSPNVDLYDPFDGNPTNDDLENGVVDSIRIENGVFQRITLKYDEWPD
tara:strand:- start:94 stop:855 length:762 start_codon:yes stop_codon:yes gene_type:complete